MASETIQGVLREMREMAEALHDRWLNDPNSFGGDRESSERMNDFADRLEAACRRANIEIDSELCAYDIDYAYIEAIRKVVDEHLGEVQEGEVGVSKKETTTMGDAARMREALEDSNGLLEELARLGEWGEAAEEQLRENLAALAAPPRNCDVGTADEQDARFSRFCVEKRSGSCSGCPDAVGGFTVANGIRECALVWAQMPYEQRPYEAKGGEE